MSHSWHPIAPSCTLSSKLHWNIDTPTSILVPNFVFFLLLLWLFLWIAWRDKSFMVFTGLCMIMDEYGWFDYACNLHHMNLRQGSETTFFQPSALRFACIGVKRTPCVDAGAASPATSHPTRRQRALETIGKPSVRKRKEEFLHGTENAKICQTVFNCNVARMLPCLKWNE